MPVLCITLVGPDSSAHSSLNKMSLNNLSSNLTSYSTTGLTYIDFQPSDFEVDPDVWRELEYLDCTSGYSHNDAAFFSPLYSQPEWPLKPQYQQSKAEHTDNQMNPPHEEVDTTKVVIDLTLDGDPMAFYPSPESQSSSQKRKKSRDWLNRPADIETAARLNSANLAVKVRAAADLLCPKGASRGKQLKEKTARGQKSVIEKKKKTASKKRKRGDMESEDPIAASQKRTRTGLEASLREKPNSTTINESQYTDEEMRAMEALFDEYGAE